MHKADMASHLLYRRFYNIQNTATFQIRNSDFRISYSGLNQVLEIWQLKLPKKRGMVQIRDSRTAVLEPHQKRSYVCEEVSTPKLGTMDELPKFHCGTNSV